MNYPRMLYPAGDVSAELIIVDDAGQEADARAQGYRIAYEEAPKVPDEQLEQAPRSKPGPKSKAK